jgi:hypothetical protein
MTIERISPASDIISDISNHLRNKTFVNSISDNIQDFRKFNDK